ncbi:hypothetical protein DFH07DRAFT_754389 [Mycena maculata]|uniref:O-methyltransferase domain-containing protein n=1 Tax=Mycena maculata TaxID=230809 RepID=A0AAD7MVW6_9AGAR|nr:hypothetical protein DFH07DRAFT_754389 [Mycena maculata]
MRFCVVSSIGYYRETLRIPSWQASTGRDQAHDFLTPQPPRKVSVFLLRMILHDWSNEYYCVKVLRHLRAAAQSSTKLFIVDNTRMLATRPSPRTSLERPPAPEPLLPSFGQSSAIAYYTDLNMMSLFNDQERPVLQLKELLKECDWKLVEVYYGDPFTVGQSKSMAVPA